MKEYDPKDKADEEVPIMNFAEEEPPEESFILLEPQFRKIEVEEQIEDLIFISDEIPRETCVDDVRYGENPARRDDESDSPKEDSDSEPEFNPKVIYIYSDSESSSFMDSNNDNNKPRNGQAKKLSMIIYKMSSLRIKLKSAC